MSRGRVSKGVPTGGQFSPDRHSESGVELGRRREMPGYQRMIAEAIDTEEPEMAALVEDFIRMEHPTLDSLSRDQLHTAARSAHGDVIAWGSGAATPEQTGHMTLADYCRVMSLDYPPSLKARGHEAEL